MTERIDTVLEELLGAQRLESCIKFLESLGVVVIYQKQIQGDWVEFVLVPKRRLTSSEEILARNLKIGVAEIETKSWPEPIDLMLDKYVRLKRLQILKGVFPLDWWEKIQTSIAPKTELFD